MPAVGALRLLVTVGDAPAGEIVGRNLYDYSVTREDSDIIHANLARYRAEDDLAVFELDFEHCVG